MTENDDTELEKSSKEVTEMNSVKFFTRFPLMSHGCFPFYFFPFFVFINWIFSYGTAEISWIKTAVFMDCNTIERTEGDFFIAPLRRLIK